MNLIILVTIPSNWSLVQRSYKIRPYVDSKNYHQDLPLIQKHKIL